MKNSSILSDLFQVLVRKSPLLLSLVGLYLVAIWQPQSMLFMTLCALIFFFSFLSEFMLKSEMFLQFAHKKSQRLANFIQKQRNATVSPKEAEILHSIEQLLAEAGQGLFENRLTGTPESSIFYKISWLVNDILDQLEAMSREIGTSISYVSRKKYFRRTRTDGLRGAFSIAGIQVNRAIESIESSTTTIENMLSQIEETSKNIAAFSATIVAAVEEMSAAVAEQSDSLGIITDSTKELQETSSSNSENLHHIALLVQNTARAAGTGNGVVVKTRTSIQEISTLARNTAQIIAEFESASRRIAESARMINEIADQTNMLALNAAIEAARAGEYGRGFAVVADEVRKLAEKTQQTTSDISKIVVQINTNARNSVQATNDSLHAVERGLELAEHAEQELSSIFKSVQEVERIVTHIAAASEEQAHASSEISERITLLTISGKESYLATQSVAESISQLNDQIETLAGMSNSLE